MIYLILYIKLGLIFTLLFVIMMSISGQDITLRDIIGTIFFYPIIIYYIITDKY